MIHNKDIPRKHIEISLGMACNNKCLFCLNDGPRKIVPYEQVLKEVTEYAGKKYNSVGFIGGDPTIYPQILELGRACSRLGYRHIHLISNGRRYSDAEFLDNIIAAGFSRFSVSVHSHRAEIEDRLTGAQGGFAQKLAGIRNLVDRFRKKAFLDLISLNVLMNKMNLDELDETLRFFAGEGIVNFRILIIRPEGWALTNSELLVPRMTAVREKLPSLIQLSKSHRLTIRMETPPYCIFHDIPGLSRILAKDYLDEIITDNITDTVRKLTSWDRQRVTSHKKKPDFCALCYFNGICEGIWNGYLDIFGPGEFHPVMERQLTSAPHGKTPSKENHGH